MGICVIGTGYVGLVAGTCLAEMGNNVICIDNDENKINDLKNGIIPIYEPGLEDLIKSNLEEDRLTFSTDIDYAVKNSSICFIAVGTPESSDGSADLQYVKEVAKSIGKAMNSYKIIVNKSTVPIGTAEIVSEIIKQETKYEFDVVSNPEFLKQGAAVDDFLRPDRIIIGADSDKAKNIMLDLYAPFVKNQNPIITMDTKSAELVKYASNSFLAIKISYANEIANICEKVGADIEKVRAGMCSDSRIGNKFLYSGIGYGGSCFPKDIKALIKTATDIGINCDIIKSADTVNTKQRQLFIQKIYNKFNQNLSNKTFAIWGLSFKPKTNDMREAPSIDVINALLNNGAKVKTYDPKAFSNAKKIFGNKIKYCKNSYEALVHTDALILLTEWNEFKNPDFNKMKSLMKTPIIFDGRNQYNAENLISNGFEYYSIGKKHKQEVIY